MADIAKKESRRRIVGPARVRQLVQFALRGGVSRVELCRAGTFSPMGDARQVAADANSALIEAGISWHAVTENGRVYLVRSES